MKYIRQSRKNNNMQFRKCRLGKEEADTLPVKKGNGEFSVVSLG